MRMSVSFCSVESRPSSLMVSSTPPRLSSREPGSSNPAWANIVSAETCSASAMLLSTSADGLYKPRSTWLKYGFDTFAISESCRKERFANSRWALMNSPRPFHGSVSFEVIARSSLYPTLLTDGAYGGPTTPRTYPPGAGSPGGSSAGATRLPLLSLAHATQSSHQLPLTRVAPARHSSAPVPRG